MSAIWPVYAVILRSPMAHGRIRSTAAAYFAGVLRIACGTYFEAFILPECCWSPSP
jgi:hypothetical protein